MSALETAEHLVTRARKCPICEAGCGLTVTIDTERRKVMRIRGDEDDPLSRGFVCPKSQGMKLLQDDPDVLKKPLLRKGRDFEEITWDAAIEMAGERFREIAAKHGPDANAAYIGNPLAHNPEGLLYTLSFAMALGSRSLYSSTSVDHLPNILASGLVFGDQSLIPVPDVDRTHYLLMLGANPVVSGGSLMTAPDMRRRMNVIYGRNGQVVVADPRRTETAAAASLHLPVRPGSDPFFLLAILQVLFRERLADTGKASAYVSGLKKLERFASSFPLGELSAACGIASEQIVRVAKEFAQAPSAACYGRTGSTQQAFGSVTSWLIYALNVVTGNIDVPGGVMFQAGVTPPVFLNETYQDGVGPHHRWFTRVKGLPEVAGQLPVAALADEILTPGEGQVRGLLTVAANPVITAPNGRRLAKALSTLEFMVACDIYLGETSRHADLILPGSGHLERTDWPIFTAAFSVRHIAKWTDQLLPPLPGTKSDGEILRALAARVAGVSEDAVDDALADHFLAIAHAKGNLGGKTPEEASAMLERQSGGDRIFEILLRSHVFGDKFGANPEGLTFAKVSAAEHGIDMGPMFARLPEALCTPSGKIELFPELLAKEEDRLRAALGAHRTDGHMLLIGRRQIHSINSWMHNIQTFNRGSDKCFALLHPEDAQRLGVESGDRIKLARKGSEIAIPVTVSDQVMPGVVSVPHGWGHDLPQTQLSHASTRPGVNSNLIASEEDIDVPSGNAVLTGLDVIVSKAA